MATKLDELYKKNSKEIEELKIGNEDLKKENYFGELGFIKGEPRCLSAKARDFTEVFIIPASICKLLIWSA